MCSHIRLRQTPCAPSFIAFMQTGECKAGHMHAYRIQAGEDMVDTVASDPDRIVRSAKADLLFVTFKFMLLANMYWLWLSLKLGSLSMFVVGLIPLSWIVTAPVSVWALVFDVPQWVLKTFA